MVNSETGTSTSNPSGGEYQVFLNFRGPDTRRTFTDILHQALVNAGISVFIDDEGLRPGERISGNLLQAISNSKLYIPIFSKDYASSHWCLDELAKMVENTSKYKEDGKEKVILPIFYDVKPDDVKLKTPLYKDAISNLAQEMEDQKNEFSSAVTETWQQALKEVGRTKGWELEKYSGYGGLIQAVVHEVVVSLETRQRHVTRHLVGMEHRIAAIQDLLDIDSDDVRFIGIYGMGGIGKTTLTKIIFNQLLPHFGRNCSFLDDVREMAKTKGLVELQKKLLSDVSYFGAAPYISNIDNGTNIIEDTICNKKMLIVLDDVDEAKQIQNLIGEKSLCPGTRVLVTTRDNNVLNIRGIKYGFKDYEMVGLSEEDALKLFCRHAFNDNSPPANYYTLSESIISATNGLPLALEAIGSSLFQRKREIWEERLEKLKKTPHKDVLGKLKISYDALELEQQQIFLDVACFFIGDNKTNPMCMWKYCEFCPEDAIEVLIRRCMIKVLDDKFWMHDQFRDLGRAIAKNERTRLWDKDDIIHELRSTEIKESVQALNLPLNDSRRGMTVTSEQIKRFPRMRFLSLPNVTYRGDFTGCLSELKWIRLHYPQIRIGSCDQNLEATNLLHLENVVVANLDGIQITKDVLDSLIKGARKLTILTIQLNTLISETPTFPEYSNLKKLTIKYFRSLKKIDCSIGKLRWLIDLNVEYCVSIEKLPEQIGELQNLQRLCLKDCFELIELPASVSKIKTLTELDVSNTKIMKLPDTIGELPNLSSLNVSYTPIVEMPSTMSKFRQLQTLHLDHCHKIQELPKLPISLTTLQLSSFSLQTVPNLSYLTNIVELLLSDGYEDRYGVIDRHGFIDTNEDRNGYEDRDPSNEFQTGDLGWIGSLTKLSNLLVCFTNVRAPTTELGSLSLLKELNLQGQDLPTFKHLPSNLIVLKLYETGGKQVHLDGLPPSEKETPFLPTSLGKSKENKVSEQLDVQSLDVLESSERSRIQDCRSSESLVCQPEEPGCNGLQAPELIDHWRGVILFPSSQKTLVQFILSGFLEVQDIQFVTPFESLEEMYVDKCFSLKSLGGLSNSKNLKRLKIHRCPSLQVVEGIDELEFLQSLNIDNCKSVGRILDPSSSKIPDNCEIFAALMESDRWLRDSSFKDCSQLKKLPEQIGELQNLRHICFDGWDRLIKLLSSVSKLKLLTKLDVHWTPIPKMPNMMGRFNIPHKLDLDYCHEIQEWPKLPISLTTLRVESILLLTIPNLSYLTNLVELVLSNHSEFSNASNVIQTCDLRWIGMLSKLRKLYLRFPNVCNVCAPTTQLDSLSLLKELTVHGIGLPAFKQLPPNLIYLDLYETRGKQVHLGGLPPSEKETLILSTSLEKSRESKVYQQLDVQFIDVLESSERSRIQDCKSSERLVCLPGEPGCSEPQAPELTDHGREVFLFPSSQKMLVKFILSGFAEVQDIQFVTAFESLEEFCVKECFSLKSLGGLSNSKNLKRLEIGHCPSLKVVEGIDELEFLGGLGIIDCGSVGRILDPLSSKIPDNCWILITDSGELPNCRTSCGGWRNDRWKSYREKILNGAKQAWSSQTKTETGDSLQKTGQKNKEKKRKKETESAKEQEKRKGRKGLKWILGPKRVGRSQIANRIRIRVLIPFSRCSIKSLSLASRRLRAQSLLAPRKLKSVVRRRLSFPRFCRPRA